MDRMFVRVCSQRGSLDEIWDREEDSLENQIGCFFNSRWTEMRAKASTYINGIYSLLLED